MNVLTDWKGNLIKAGDVLCVYRYMSDSPVSVGFVMVDMEVGRIDLVKEPVRECPKYGWTRISKGKVVVSGSGYMFVMQEDENENTLTDLLLYLRAFTSNKLAICIEGKSDNEYQFFKHYFDNN